MVTAAPGRMATGYAPVSLFRPNPPGVDRRGAAPPEERVDIRITSSQISDGASALLVASGEAVETVDASTGAPADSRAKGYGPGGRSRFRSGTRTANG